MPIRHLAALLALAALVALPACARSPDAVAATTAATSSGTDASAPADASSASPLVVVHKDPYCGCCGSWIEHMRAAGFPVEVRDVADVMPIKQRVGLPAGKESCHTAEVAGYFIEGHVPADDVKRLLAEAPDARGLAVPGMPAGSPGMEVPGGHVDPYVVELIGRDGSTSAYARHGH
ncbi:copper amine oxidase [Lysobacter concretionis Ko07 = DSM 16239]|jgi:hypothetical protein|uniref:Copper amine oxidase n=1 Tax=Lysobacter concretionis Ko07 = DSM 16239 TaxID=1122185 RepID=A0A0A0ER60_9GAMM|nr:MULTISPECIES: DUF411 domain-containing protein [Lysobacter]KGM51667.1 copper amine oxidase [Lysobacter concretionis Ko07 = DSM 16239]QOD92272.1 DUF411 domain-containing protein [Lysobacter sp. CW239]